MKGGHQLRETLKAASHIRHTFNIFEKSSFSDTDWTSSGWRRSPRCQELSCRYNLEYDVYKRALINAYVKSTSRDKQVMYSNNYSSLKIKGTSHEDSPMAPVNNVAENPVECRPSKMVRAPTMSKVLGIVRAPEISLQVENIQTLLMRQDLARTTWCLCNVAASHSFCTHVANWPI